MSRQAQILFATLSLLLCAVLLLTAQAGTPVSAEPNACVAINSPNDLSETELITFDDLENGFNIGTHYQSTYGVVFEDSRDARVNAVAYGGAHSAPNVAMNEAIGLSEMDAPLTMTFDEPLTGVGFWVGNSGAEDVTAQVFAFDEEGSEICASESAGSLPVDHDLFLGLFDEQKRIVKVIVNYDSDAVAESLDDLMISEAGQVIAPTFTPTPTNTPTATPTATPAPYDLRARSMEVTQGVQDLNNSVPLIRGKRTYVRFNVTANPFKFIPAEAILGIQCQGCPFNPPATGVSPINGVQGKLIVPQTVSRTAVNQSFLFEVPFLYTLGDKLVLTAQVDPNNKIVETDESNNILLARSFDMQPVNPIEIRLTSLSYDFGGTTFTPRLFDDIANSLRWMKQAFPVNSIQFELNNRTHNGPVFGDGQAYPTMLAPGCSGLNYDTLIAAGFFNQPGQLVTTSRDYTMISDGGAWMRGCANWGGSSGPTGPVRFFQQLQPILWDTDSSYGDWYMAHEVAHSYGRPHNLCRGDEAGAVPQYPGGRISPVTGNGPNAIYGLERFWDGSFRTYTPTSGDVMTYCPNQWPSDITYKALLNRFNELLPPAVQTANGSADEDLLLVAGTIYPTGSSADLLPVFLMPDVPDPKPRVPGDYDIVLRDGGGSELARYPFTPEATVTEGQPPSLAALEFVPPVAGMARLELVGPGDMVFAAVEPGPGAPQVTVLAPNGGETLLGTSFEVQWQASDPDGDPLTYQVHTSADGGATWSVVATSQGATQVTIDKSNTPASSQTLVRVLASDGLHTGSDTSDATFTIPNQKPTVEILSPPDGTVIAASQTLGMEGWAYDNDSGLMSGEAVQWRSNRDGLLGNGEALSVTGLSVGTHLLKLLADDGAGGTAEKTITVTVVGSLDDLPVPADALVVEPGFLQFRPGIEPDQQALEVSNANVLQALGWTASSDAPWLQLSTSSGQTPQQITVEVDQGQATWTDREAVVIFTPEGGGDPVEVHVQMTPARSQVVLPLVVRP